MSKVKATKPELVRLLEEAYTYVVDIKNEGELCDKGEDLVHRLGCVLNKSKKISDLTLFISLDTFNLDYSLDPFDSNTYEVVVKLRGSNETISHHIYNLY